MTVIATTTPGNGNSDVWRQRQRHRCRISEFFLCKRKIIDARKSEGKKKKKKLTQPLLRLTCLSE